MCTRTLLKGALAILLATTSVVSADAFNPKAVPVDAKWVIHVDVDALATSPLWSFVEDRMNENAEAQAKLQEMETITGMVFPQDLHSVTVYGLGFEEPDGVILIKARANQQQLLGMLQTNASYSTSAHGDHEVLSWEDKGKLMHGSFFSADTVIMAQSQENVEKAIDTLAAKGPSISADSAMNKTTGTGVLAALASDSVAYLAKKDKNNPILNNVKTAAITLSQQGEDVGLRGVFDCGTEQVAAQMKAMAEGLKAAGILFAQNPDADAKLKMIAPLLPGATVTQEGKNVMLLWTVPMLQVKTLAEQLHAANAGK